MDKVTIWAPAKLNLTLDVKGKRPDGYHELETIMQAISLKDKITIDKANTIIVNSNSSQLSNDANNLAYYAAELFFQETGKKAGVNIYIEKNIPIGAGLAGGSSNAAAVLLGLNHLYQTKLSLKDLAELALEIGSDVPFCIFNRTALARGRGEILSPLPKGHTLNFLLVKPNFSVATKDVFGQLDLDKIKKRPNNEAFIKAWRDMDLDKMAFEMINVLETVTVSLYPEIGLIKQRLLELGAVNAVMSGSGPSVFALFRDEDKLKIAYNYMVSDYDEAYIVSSYFGSE